MASIIPKSYDDHAHANGRPISVTEFAGCAIRAGFSDGSSVGFSVGFSGHTHANHGVGLSFHGDVD